MKLTELQRFKLREADRHLTSVLAEIKMRPLHGKALKEMLELEGIKTRLECVLIGK